MTPESKRQVGSAVYRKPEATPAAAPVRKPAGDPLARPFAAAFGLLIGLALLKFGNPVIMDKYVDRPGGVYEWLLNSWPVHWGYGTLAGVGVLGALTARWRKDLPWWLLGLPLVWLGWQFVAAAGSISPHLTAMTLLHFSSCVACFYLGVFALGRSTHLSLFSLGVLAGFVCVLVSGFRQHFGGLEETRQYFLTYIYPTLKEVPAAYLKRMFSNRIFATLFYANTLAGVVLMLLPPSLAFIWSWEKQLTAAARSFLMGMMGIAALACLFWSGSKGGWLLMLILLFAGVLFLPFRKELKVLLVAGVLVLGITGFVWKYAGFFKRGAPSVAERFHYWHAALVTAEHHPITGTGPGTFGIAYEKIRQPDWEGARMTHNDYLEQASDSGVVGFLSFTGFVAASLVFAFRRGRLKDDWVRLAVWLGLLGWSLQSLVEFGLYIPACSRNWANSRRRLKNPWPRARRWNGTPTWIRNCARNGKTN